MPPQATPSSIVPRDASSNHTNQARLDMFAGEHGQTSSDGTVRFHIALSASVDEQIALLKEHSFYRAADGVKIDATTTYGEGRSLADTALVVRPLTELLSDKWYWLVVPTTDALGIQERGYTPPDEWSLHFFTGSAPHLILANVPDDGGPWSLTFSEPLDISSYASNGAIAVGETAMSFCVMRGVECYTNGPWVSEVMAIRFDVAPGPTPVTSVKVPGAMSAGMAGSRSVSEGREAMGLPAGDALTNVDFTKVPLVSGQRIWAEAGPPE